jgi:predicted nucleic acid-binding protein
VITAVDTSALLDVFGADPTYGAASRAALTRSLDEGALVAGDVVWAEIAAAFSRCRAGGRRAVDPRRRLSAPSPLPAPLPPARRGGSIDGPGARVRGIPDFLIGAHARVRPTAC